MLRRLRAKAAPAEPADPPDLLDQLPPAQRWVLNHATDEDRAILEQTVRLTMTGLPRLQSLIDAVRHCVSAQVPGAFAECGVWRGGSVLAMILTLQELGVDDRDIYLYDTFEGMTEPSDADVSRLDPPALDTWKEAESSGERAWLWLFDSELFNEEDVHRTVLGSGYPAERVHFVRGKVEDTVPAQAPGEIALLRLDTDWYESTLHEMTHLYPRLARGGVLIVDDYGHWEGARRAVDEHFAAHPPAPMLHRIDYSGRIGLRP
jgi:O-methyltransferase